MTPDQHLHTWSMDFMHDGLIDGKSFRSFNVVDDYNREVLNITIEKGMPSKRVIRELDKLIEWRGTPERIRVDNGPEFVSEAMRKWCEEHQIELKFIQPTLCIRKSEWWLKELDVIEDMFQKVPSFAFC